MTCKSCGQSDFKEGKCAYCGTEAGLTGEPIVDDYLRIQKRLKILADEGFTLKRVEKDVTDKEIDTNLMLYKIGLEAESWNNYTFFKSKAGKKEIEEALKEERARILKNRIIWKGWEATNVNARYSMVSYAPNLPSVLEEILTRHYRTKSDELEKQFKV